MITEYNDIQLLYIALSKLYGSDTATKLMIKYKDNLFGYHGLAWATGKRDL